MKKNLFLVCALPLALTLASCNGPKPNQNEPEQQTGSDTEEVVQTKEKAFPWDFPEGNKNEGLAEGIVALSCHSFYPSALEESDDPAEATLIFYNGKISTVGDTKSSISSFGDDIEMPNSLIIPIPEGQTAKKGDIILTWWQSGSGMQRAIVTDASDPTSPKVDYLDLDYKDDGTGIANKHSENQIKPNTFVVLKDGEWQPGAQVIAGSGKEGGILISATNDKVLLLCFASKVKVFDKSECKLLPLNQGLKVGDEVCATFVGEYRSGAKITKIDEKIGRVWVENSFGSEIKSILNVYKEQ